MVIKNTPSSSMSDQLKAEIQIASAMQEVFAESRNLSNQIEHASEILEKTLASDKENKKFGKPTMENVFPQLFAIIDKMDKIESKLKKRETEFKKTERTSVFENIGKKIDRTNEALEKLLDKKDADPKESGGTDVFKGMAEFRLATKTLTSKIGLVVTAITSALAFGKFMYDTNPSSHKDIKDLNGNFGQEPKKDPTADAFNTLRNKETSKDTNANKTQSQSILPSHPTVRSHTPLLAPGTINHPSIHSSTPLLPPAQHNATNTSETPAIAKLQEKNESKSSSIDKNSITYSAHEIIFKADNISFGNIGNAAYNPSGSMSSSSLSAEPLSGISGNETNTTRRTSTSNITNNEPSKPSPEKFQTKPGEDRVSSGMAVKAISPSSNKLTTNSFDKVAKTNYSFNTLQSFSGLNRNEIEAVREMMHQVESGKKGYTLNDQGYRNTSNFGFYQFNNEDVKDIHKKYFSNEPLPSQDELLHNPQLQDRYYEHYLKLRYDKLSPKDKQQFDSLSEKAKAGDKDAKLKIANWIGASQAGRAGSPVAMLYGADPHNMMSAEANPHRLSLWTDPLHKNLEKVWQENPSNGTDPSQYGTTFQPQAIKASDTTQSSNNAVKYYGDSIANMVSGQKDYNIGGINKENPETLSHLTRVSRRPDQVLETLKQNPPQKGDRIALSTGVLNPHDANDMKVVEEQIKFIKDHGADVVVMGTNNPDLNHKLETLSKQYKIPFAGGYQTPGKDPHQFNAKNYKNIVENKFNSIKPTDSGPHLRRPNIEPKKPEPIKENPKTDSGPHLRKKQTPETEPPEKKRVSPDKALLDHIYSEMA
jgi:hypothetical protein